MRDDHAGLDAAARGRLRDALSRLDGDPGPDAYAALSALVAPTEVRVEAPGPWLPWVDAARRAWSVDGRPPAVPGLPPCLQLARRPAWPGAPAMAPDVGCAAAADCPVGRCAHRGEAKDGGAADGPAPLRFGDAAAAARGAAAAICAAWGHGLSPVFDDWLSAMRAMNPDVGPARFEFSLKRAGDALAPRLRVVDLDPGAVDDAAGAARRSQVASWYAARSTPAIGEAARQFIDLFGVHHGPRAGLSVGLDCPLDGGPPRLQLYAHQGFGDQAPNRAHLLAALRWSGADPDAVARMARLIADRGVALVVFAPGPGDPRGVKVYVAAPFALAAPALDLPALAPPPYAVDWSLAVWRCGAGGLAWEKRDFPLAGHPQQSAGPLADFVEGLPPAERTRALALFDGRAFLPWFTWNSVRPGARTLYFHAR